MLRASLRVGGLLLLFLACLGPHLLEKALTGRSRWPRKFLAAAAWIIGARVRIVGEPVRPHSLLICNHVSWIDVLVVAGATGCRFVSKDELGHPLVHWMADQNDTLYVRRSHRRGSADQATAIAGALQRPQPLALFPEGTTGPGDDLLPFRSTLLAAVAPPPDAVEVRPVAIDYGPAAPEIGWHGETGKDNVLRILARRGGLPVVVHLLPALERSADRKQLASAARARISEALAASSSSTAGL
ncbi:MAG TPA: lysophospholipid acyltransferase family protein [Sphingomicrobium sp.]|nr:lysophospholipid acyltransferase family protein [Sphingomicrobium sp.]